MAKKKSKLTGISRVPGSNTPVEHGVDFVIEDKSGADASFRGRLVTSDPLKNVVSSVKRPAVVGVNPNALVSAVAEMEVTEAIKLLAQQFTLLKQSFAGDLKGEPGRIGPAGVPGSRPAHEWDSQNEQVRFQRADGAWGSWNHFAEGPQGIQGETGLTGLQGATGARGYQGEQGETGNQGIQGLQGDQGIQGIQGGQGLQGDQGIAGPTGQTGQQGQRGYQGPQGLQGETGLTGPSGSAGPQGLQGETGLTGASGSSGLAPSHEWSGTQIRFQNADGSWGDYTELALSGALSASTILGTFDAVDLRATNGGRYRLEVTDTGDLTFATASNIIANETYLVTDEVKLRADNGNIYTLSATDAGDLVFYTGSLS